MSDRVDELLERVRLLYLKRRAELSVRVPETAQLDARRAMPPVDTTGAYRPPFRSQFGDPHESHTTPHSEGSNCTMSSAAMALRYESVVTGSDLDYWGGDMRHAQSDNEGGTDLYDAAEAWARKGHELTIRSGAGWGAVIDALDEGRGVILQGTGGVAGCGNYTGGHAIYINPEKSGTRWLKADPECSGYEWTEESVLKGFAQRLSSGVYFAVTAAPGSEGEPVGMRVDIYEAFHATLTINDDGAQAVQLADSDMIGMPRGQQRECFARARLSEDWSTPGGTKFAKGTEGYLIGTETSFVFGHNADVAPIDESDDVDAAIGARDDEWIDALVNAKPWPSVGD